MPTGRASGLAREWTRLRGGALRNLHEPLFGLVLASLGGVIAGILIGVNTDRIALIPALIVLIPGAISMRGNIFSAMGSRLGSQLHLGYLPAKFRWGPVMAQNHRSSFVLSLTMSTYLGLLAGILAYLLGLPATVPELILISVIAGLASGFLLFFFTALVALGAYRMGWDPDNISASLVTLAGDLLTLPILFASVEVVLLIPETLLWPLAALFLVASVAAYLVIFLATGKRHTLSRRVVVESVPIFALAGLFSTGSGFLLGTHIDSLLGKSGLLTIIPAFLENGGAIGGILAARFTSRLHTGQLAPGLRPSRDVKDLFVLTHLLGFVIFPFIGLFGHFINTALDITTPDLGRFVLTALIAGQVLLLFVNAVSFYSAVVTHRFGLDPDNLVIPIITSVMDLIGTSLLIGTALLTGVL